jgi:hypothetical protein
MRVLAMLLSLEGGLPPFAMALLLWFGGDWRLINRRAVLRDALAAASALTIVGAVKVFSMPLEAAFLMVGGGAAGLIMVWLYFRQERHQLNSPQLASKIPANLEYILVGISGLPLLGGAVAYLVSSM